jgi:hypothetical protein
MINTNYWYYSQIRGIILHTLRLFQNFCISEGIDENGDNILRRVPCVYMSTDKSVLHMLNNATDTILEVCPKMVLAISEVKLNNNLISGSPYFEYETSVTEKRFNPDSGNYEYSPGNSYNITRLNPLPLGIIFKLYILTSMQEHKFQLFEQIRSIFSPTLELQTSENPLDWSRVTAITLTGLNWSTKGASNLDSSTLDSLDMTFEINTNLDMPSIIQKEKMIEQIVHSIGSGDTLEDIMSWSLEDVTRTYHSPTNNRVSVFYDEKLGRQRIKLEPSEKCTDWFKLLEIYNIKYNVVTHNVNIHILSNSNIDQRNDIIGYLHLDPKTPNIADFRIFEDSLPSTNIDPVNYTIDPHSFDKQYIVNGYRYLITEDIPNNTKMFGQLYYNDGTPLESNEYFKENSIIRYENNQWILDLDPSQIPGVYYVRDLSNPLFIYTYNNEYHIWTDVVNKSYPVGFWRISESNK